MTCPSARIFRLARAAGSLSYEDFRAFLEHLVPLCPECSAAWETGMEALQSWTPRAISGGPDVDFWFTHREPFAPPPLLTTLLQYPRDIHAHWIATDPRFRRPEVLEPMEAHLDHGVTEPFEDRLHLARLFQILTLQMGVEDGDLTAIWGHRVSACRLVGEALILRGEMEAAAEVLTWAFAVGKGCQPDILVMAEVVTTRALMACLRAEYDVAWQDLRWVLTIYRTAGEPLLEASTLIKLAFVALERFELAEARSHAARALDLLGTQPELRLAHQARDILDTLQVPAGSVSPFAPGPFTLRRAH